MRRASATLPLITALAWVGQRVTLAVGPEGAGGQEAAKPHFDVCDASYLWPVPQSAADVRVLVSADEAHDETKAAIWPAAPFARMLEVARSDAAVIKDPRSGRDRRIDLPPEIVDRGHWKVAAFRVDPGAPGAHSAIVAKFGAAPQLRIILQPVTVAEGSVRVHDVTAHLVYNYVKDPKKAEAGFLPVNVPDTEKFTAILDDLAKLKDSLKGKGIDTRGVPLGVHPGLRRNAGVADFGGEVKSFLTRHVSERNLTAMAFMGLAPAPEPWVFVAAAKQGNGTFAPAPIPALGLKPAQMLSFADGGPRVLPEPAATNRNPVSNFLGTPPADRRGVATAALFAPGVRLDDLAVIGRAADGTEVRDPGGDKPLRNRDIADLVANPQIAHFFNTDCISCHSESTRRRALRLPDSPSFRYKAPDGVSGVDPALLPEEDWNVRNFGWFPSFFRRSTKATVTMRTANETAECVEFINREYFGRQR